MHFSNLISKLFGVFGAYEFNTKLQNIINKIYVVLMGLDMNEFKNYNKYNSLNALFTRKIIKKRKINNNKNIFISPCDGLITLNEKIKSLNQVAQIKGKTYNLNELLTNKITKKNLNLLIGGEYINIYLSPKDYHRYHCPFDMQILKAIYVPAKLFPVNTFALNFVNNLFIKNERVILECISENKMFYMVFVGALNVGKMIFNFDKNIQTNIKTNTNIRTYAYENLFIKKADELGYFMLGSTILIFWQKNMVNINNKTNKKIRFGNKIALLA